MNLQSYDSFDEVAKSWLTACDLVSRNSRDIVKACTFSHPEHAAALERVIVAFKVKFSTPAEFRAAITDSSFIPPGGLALQMLFHLAGRWTEYEKIHASIEREREKTAKQMGKLIYREGTQPMTSEEYERTRKRKLQRKKDRGRNRK